ncbi:MAG TPA: hypothetical protein VJ276_15305 [Thermoanaerobaculia bacterium]|nr:hypothetical protein [Thermoanaerobaculia bacterium]
MPVSRLAILLTLAGLVAGGCASGGAVPHAAAQPAAASCDLAAAGPWIARWFTAWQLTSREILRLPDAPLPDLVFYDGACVYTTSRVTAGVSSNARGAAVPGVGLEWWAAKHEGSLTLPSSKKLPVQLMSFADSDKESGPFFVMAAPAYWAQTGKGQEPGLTAVFLHEISHTRQFPGMAGIIGPIDAAWKFPEELDDDIVQTRFASNPAYVEAYLAERDLLYRAAEADSVADARALAAQALAMMRSRHARWFTGDNAVFATLDSTWLSMEGTGQWAGYAWLAHPRGGGLARDAAVKRMLGSRRRWSQDEGLALFLVVDRLLPEWPSLVFGTPSMGAVELLERAVRQ